VLATAAAARTAHAAGFLVAGYWLSFLIDTGIMVLAAVLIMVQLRLAGSPHDAEVHQPTGALSRFARWPSVSFASAELPGGPGSVQVPPPVAGHRPGWAGHGLVRRVAVGRGQDRALEERACPIVEEPVLAGLEALRHRVPGGPMVGAGVLARRVIAAADVPAPGASAQMQPPAR
jgi:hypothetical protein